MTIVLLSAAAFLLATLGLCLGVLMGRRPLAGSCGGLACMKDDQGQPMCGHCRRRDEPVTTGETNS